VASLFAAVLVVNPIEHLLSMGGHLASLPKEAQHVLTGRQFFPHLLSAPFHSGLTIVFCVSAGLAVISAVASLMRGSRRSADGRDEPHTEFGGDGELVGVAAGDEG
jgi:hypothetical protein